MIDPRPIFGLMSVSQQILRGGWSKTIVMPSVPERKTHCNTTSVGEEMGIGVLISYVSGQSLQVFQQEIGGILYRMS